MTIYAFSVQLLAMGDLANQFPARIKALRTRLGYSQSLFAEAVRVNLRTLQNWEIARVIPAYHELILMGLRQRVSALLESGRPKKNRNQRGQK